MQTIYSMTGFAVASKELPYGTVNVELRSVNHRYLDIQLKVPEELRTSEQALRELITSHIGRGKVECRVSVNARENQERTLNLNTELLQSLWGLNQQVRTAFTGSADLSVADILRWPGILGSETLSLEELNETTFELARTVLTEFNASRTREGEKLKQLLLDRVNQMQTLIAGVTPRMPVLLKAYQEKLATRLREAMTTYDDERLRQEVTLFAAKIDVDEELSRLTTHISEVQRILNNGGTAGKRLDFLMQELNREANTLGSKSIDVEISKISMALKVLIEQMREQVQNIE